jgi:hypothetical protein
LVALNYRLFNWEKEVTTAKQSSINFFKPIAMLMHEVTEKARSNYMNLSEIARAFMILILPGTELQVCIILLSSLRRNEVKKSQLLFLIVWLSFISFFTEVFSGFALLVCSADFSHDGP